MNCLRCGIEIVPNANFCHTCGQRLHGAWDLLDSDSGNQDVNVAAGERGVAMGRDAMGNTMLTGDTNQVVGGDGIRGNKIAISGEQDFPPGLSPGWYVNLRKLTFALVLESTL